MAEETRDDDMAEETYDEDAIENTAALEVVHVSDAGATVYRQHAKCKIYVQDVEDHAYSNDKLDVQLTECELCESPVPEYPTDVLRNLLDQYSVLARNGPSSAGLQLEWKICARINFENRDLALARLHEYDRPIDFNIVRQRVLNLEVKLRPIFRNQHLAVVAKELYERYEVERRGAALLMGNMDVASLLRPG